MKKHESIFALLTDLRNQSRQIKKEINRLPKGRLMIYDRKGLTEFFRVTISGENRRKRTVINDNDELLYSLAHKAYLQEKLERLEADALVCEKLLKNWRSLDDQSIVTSLPKHFDLLEFAAVVNTAFRSGNVFCPCPVSDGSVAPVDARTDIGDMGLEEWASLPYCVNTKFQERKIHRAGNGLMCRSKGETSLIELCNKLGYRYHYDETVWIGDRLCSPDLIIARKDGSLVYVEHRGWKGETYERSNLEKDRLYFEAGIRQGRNYLITFETDDGGIDIELVELQLRRIVEI